MKENDVPQDQEIMVEEVQEDGSILRFKARVGKWPDPPKHDPSVA